MTTAKLRKALYKTYQKGQCVKLLVKGDEEKKKVQKLVKIEEFYPYHVLTVYRGHYECFTHHDFLKMAQDAKNLTRRDQYAS